MLFRIVRVVSIALGMATLAACGGFGSPPSSPLNNLSVSKLRELARPRSTNPIQHVVIIIQENRSFNNLFMGYPGATTSKTGYLSNGKKVKIKPIPLKTTWDVEHDAKGFFAACNGSGSIPGTNCKMNGFDKIAARCGQSGEPSCPIPHPQYSYVPQKDIAPYFTMAKQYVLTDQLYASNLDMSSFVAHQYLISAEAEQSVNFPGFSNDWGCQGGSGDLVNKIGPNRQVPDGDEPACFNESSLGQEADSAGITWGFYTSKLGADGQIWNAYQSNQYVYYGSDWNNDVITPQKQFFTDVSNGNLRQINWVTPTYENSDHPGSGSDTGPMWVASLVNAIGQSQYWDNTAIFIVWDDPGGWFDPEPPAYVDYDGLGMRVPMLVVSAYAKKGYVSHVSYEFGSILKFTEDLFNLPSLSASDARATSPQKDCFDFKKPPRKFQVIPSALGKAYFVDQPLDPRPVDTE